jgi:hypothetical protein
MQGRRGALYSSWMEGCFLRGTERYKASEKEDAVDRVLLKVIRQDSEPGV